MINWEILPLLETSGRARLEIDFACWMLVRAAAHIQRTKPVYNKRPPAHSELPAPAAGAVRVLYLSTCAGAPAPFPAAALEPARCANRV
jgi:hypothetical protein